MSKSNFDKSMLATLQSMRRTARGEAAHNLRAARRFLKLNPRLAISYAKRGGAWKESAENCTRKINNINMNP